MRTIRTKDKAGRLVTIYAITEKIRAGTLDDPHATIDGLTTLRTDRGEPVNSLGDGRYLIVTTGVEVEEA